MAIVATSMIVDEDIAEDEQPEVERKQSPISRYETAQNKKKVNFTTRTSPKRSRVPSIAS